MIMAKPIEATPILTEEEWNVFMKSVHTVLSKPFQLHSVNLQQIRNIMSKRKLENAKDKRLS